MKKEITAIAKQYYWKKIESKDPFMVSFSKDVDALPVRINVWCNLKNDYLTVGTCLTHPKKGKTQLFRKFVTLEELKKYFINPRAHSGKGYR